MTQNRINRLLELCLTAGVTMLRHGAETSRVEETISRFAYAAGAQRAHSFVIPTGIFLSVTIENHEQTRMHRIQKLHEVDLEKVARVNELSRQLEYGRITQEQAWELLQEVKNTPSRYPRWLLHVFAALSGGGYTVLFGGSWVDFLPAFIGAGLSNWVNEQVDNRMPKFLAVFFGALVGTLAAIIMEKIGFAKNIDLILLGTVIPLVPGLAVTNSARDLMAGDLVSGVARGAEALLTACAIAVGVVLTLVIEVGVRG